MARLVLTVLLVVPRLAQANFADVFDLGPAMGRVGAVAALSSSGAAAFYNPAGLAWAEVPELRLGVASAYSALRLGGRRAPITEPGGILLEVATRLPLRGLLAERVAVGAALHLPPGAWLSVFAPASTTPSFPFYHNRVQRLVAMPALAVRLHEKLALGVGLNYFAGVSGRAFAADGAYGDLQADVEQEFLGVAVGHVGLRAEHGPLSVALVYRARFTVPVALESGARLADTPLALDITTDALFTPETFVLAGAYRHPAFTLSLDLSWRRWFDYRAPFARVSGEVPVPLSQSGETFTVESRFAAPETRDVPRVALGLELPLGERWQLSAGWGFEPSPFVSSDGPANLVDGAKQLVGLGVAWFGPTVGRLRWALELATQAHLVQRTRLRKDPALLPDEDPLAPGLQTANLGYPSIAGGGAVVAGALSLRLMLDPEAR